MLRIDLRAVSESPVELSGTIAGDDDVFDAIDLDLRGPVRVTGRVAGAGGGRFFWRGRIQAILGGECRRCLDSVETPVDAKVELLLTEDPDSEDPSEYPLPCEAQMLDLREPVREELVLVAPPFVLCKEDCRGLCDRCGKDLNEGPCDCRPEADPRWAMLEALKDTKSGDEES